MRVSALLYCEVTDTAGAAVCGLSSGSRQEFDCDSFMNTYTACTSERGSSARQLQNRSTPQINRPPARIEAPTTATSPRQSCLEVCLH